MSAAGLVPSAARDAASATDAPPASASSTAMARIGVDAMLTRPTESPCTATPTMAQSMARLVNFWNDQPAAAGLGTRISVSSSPGSSAVSNRPRKKSPAAISRAPDRPVATSVASRARTAAGRSEAGSACASDPPMVPRGRTCGSPTVSKVFNNHKDIGAATRERVLRRMKELNYQPSLAAQGLASKQSFMVGLIVPDLERGLFGQP